MRLLNLLSIYFLKYAFVNFLTKTLSEKAAAVSAGITKKLQALVTLIIRLVS